ncbi:MAG: hypothetical protein EB115_12890, partial [Betaproteobacteria bacterium]|nr:hypothetical protein [Betaproteobacteria bacterium]
QSIDWVIHFCYNSGTVDNKEQVMYSREFRELPVGRLFRCNGNDYFKQSTRTARRLANGRVIYFGKSEIIHPIAY